MKTEDTRIRPWIQFEDQTEVKKLRVFMALRNQPQERFLARLLMLGIKFMEENELKSRDKALINSHSGKYQERVSMKEIIKQAKEIS
jgi:hypothetical protein